MAKLLSGNQAIALGAYEAGVSMGFGYPGTPSTEILESLSAMHAPDLTCEWSPNEKVALEAAAGASFTGVRCLVTMKLVGLNVAADPLMSLSYLGVVGGLVIVVADDPGQHSSQTEQDTRHYARLAKVPILEPASARDCRDFTKIAFAISERDACPVILRTTTCVSHSRGLVEPGPRGAVRTARFEPNPSKFVPLPVWGRKMRIHAEDRLEKQARDAETRSDLNTVLLPRTQSKAGEKYPLGIISSGIVAMYCRELFSRAPILKIGWGFPFPDAIFKDFAKSVDRLIVIEEGDPILEEHIRSLGIACDGKNIVPKCGELTPGRIQEIRAKIDGVPSPLRAPVPEAADLPARPPMLCPGCPHRAMFYALSRFDVIVSGDIGCYSLGVFPPLSRTDTILCMGGGFTVAHGMERAGEKRPVVGIVGDSTFFHSGIPGLIEVVYNLGKATLIVADNRITAMTGHQEHPGTGMTLDGHPTIAASNEDIARACGLTHVFVCDPNDLPAFTARLKAEIEFDGPSLIISRAPCPVHRKKRLGPVCSIDPEKCKKCKACLKCGCPAIVCGASGVPRIDPALCAGCSLCRQLCKFGAISQGADNAN